MENVSFFLFYEINFTRHSGGHASARQLATVFLH